jgi:effector-binding domain-containing protein
VAYISFKGSYDEVPVLLGEIVGFIGAPMEIYLSDPNEVPENELLTEV